MHSSNAISEQTESLNILIDNKISVLREYITYDLYLREHMKNRPFFVPSLENRKNNIYEILHNESETHILFPELSDCNYRELTKILHVEVFEYIFDKPVAVLFYYDRRDPLTNNCITVKVPVSN